MTAKEKVQQLLDKLPDDADLEQIQVENGIEAGDEGRVRSHEEVRRRVRLE